MATSHEDKRHLFLARKMPRQKENAENGKLFVF
jgi:hypothetical protein